MTSRFRRPKDGVPTIKDFDEYVYPSSPRIDHRPRHPAFRRQPFQRCRFVFGHGSDNAHDEAAYLILHTLNLPLDTLEPYLDAKLLQSEKEEVLAVLERRAVEHIPAAYLTHQAWQGDFDFYVDERVIVPRSFIYELLGDNLTPWIEHPDWFTAHWTCVPAAAASPFKWHTTIPPLKLTPSI